MHGKTSTVVHDGKGVFGGITAPFPAGRYHSLVIAGDDVPAELEVAARDRRKTAPSWPCGTGRTRCTACSFTPSRC